MTTPPSVPRRVTWMIRLASALAGILVAGPSLAGQLTLTWNDNAKDELGTRIERRLNISGSYSQIATLGPDVTSYTDTSVTAGQDYCYRVLAYNAAGVSDYSDEACGVVPVALTVSTNGNGTVTSIAPSHGINCGDDCTTPCRAAPRSPSPPPPAAAPFSPAGAGAAAATSAPAPYPSPPTPTVTASFTALLDRAVQPGATTPSTRAARRPRSRSRDRRRRAQVQVHYETSDGTAVAGVDYTHTEGDLVFSPGQTSKTFTVPVTNNTVVDRAADRPAAPQQPSRRGAGGPRDGGPDDPGRRRGRHVQVLRDWIHVPGQPGLRDHHE